MKKYNESLEGFRERGLEQPFNLHISLKPTGSGMLDVRQHFGVSFTTHAQLLQGSRRGFGLRFAPQSLFVSHKVM